MATPVFCCGFECGVSLTGHLINVAGISFVTSPVRSGLRALRVNTTAAVASSRWNGDGTTRTRLIGRIYIRFATLPDVDTGLAWTGSLADTGPQVRFKQADSKIYAAVDTTLGATGVSVTTGIWYLIEYDFNISTGGNDVCDVRVDGVACGQATAAGMSVGQTIYRLGVANTCTADIYFDDWILSGTAADYPLGPGYIISYIPNADGSHNVAGANDFERTLTGTDITNATTDAWQLVADRPLPSTAVDFINGIAPPNSTDYVEVAFEDSVEPAAPRTVEALVVYHDAGGAGTNNFSVTLRDSNGGTTADIMAAATRNVGSVITLGRAHFTTIPGGGAWTSTAFNALRSRFLVSDASPDPYIDALMLEAEFQPALPSALFNRPYGQAGINQAQQLLAT